MAQAHYRRRLDPATRPAPRESTVARVGRALLLLLGLGLLVASCLALAELVRGGWGRAPLYGATLGVQSAPVDLAALLPALLFPLGAILSFVVSSVLRCRAAS